MIHHLTLRITRLRFTTGNKINLSFLTLVQYVEIFDIHYELYANKSIILFYVKEALFNEILSYTTIINRLLFNLVYF